MEAQRVSREVSVISLDRHLLHVKVVSWTIRPLLICEVDGRAEFSTNDAGFAFGRLEELCLTVRHKEVRSG